ncbi:hypothetical protein Avbf_14687 [Armadillidium vulgare]|nr:hypothetical protein Avbf_14687 [Armadillidium vulgare]
MRSSLPRKLKIGARVFVVLTDYSLIKSAFQKHEISGRPFYFHYNTLKKSSHYGVILSQGHVWATNRRFALKTLRDFGFGKTPILDSIILNEANSLVQDLKKNDGKPVIIDWNVNVAVLNVTWKLVANRRYNVDDEYIKKFSQLTFDMFEDMEGPMALLTVFPWLIPILPDFIKNKWMRVSSLIKKREEILGLLKDQSKNTRKIST